MPRRTAPSPWPTNRVGGDAVPRRSDSVHGVELDSESVLYDERTGGLHFLNWSASAVWWSIDGRATAAQLAAGLAERFHASDAAMRADVDTLLAMLGSQQLIVATPGRSRGAGCA